jgi:hypothetical protein
MEPGWLDVLLLWAGCVVVAFALRRASLWRAAHRLAVGFEDRLHRDDLPRPAGRPFELVARDARRLASRYHHPAPGVAFVKAEAIRRAYDKVLAECCLALDIAHLLDALPPGVELDNERRRVEHLLADAGLWISDAAV